MNKIEVNANTSNKSPKVLRKSISNKLVKLLKWKYRVSEDVSIIDNNPLSGAYNDLLLKPNEHNEPCNIEPLSSPLSQLQVIIRQLELQNKELQDVLKCNKRNDKEIKSYLEEHRQHVSTQISKLKILKEYLNPTNVQDVPEKRGREYSVPVQSTPMVPNHHSAGAIRRGIRDMDAFSPIPQLSELSNESPSRTYDVAVNSQKCNTELSFDSNSNTNPYSMKDISSWIGGQPNNRLMAYEDDMKQSIEQTDLDDALAKLQQILANNFSLDESLGNVDNCQLKTAVNEVEGVLSTIIDNVESNQQISSPNSCAVSEYKSFSTGSFLSAKSHFQHSLIRPQL